MTVNTAIRFALVLWVCSAIGVSASAQTTRPAVSLCEIDVTSPVVTGPSWKKVSLTFSSDGLIEGYHQYSPDGTPIRSFTIARNGDDYAVQYSQNDRASFVTGFRLAADSASIQISTLRVGDTIAIRHVPSPDDSVDVYVHQYGDKAYIRYEFGAETTRISYLSSGKGFVYSVNSATRNLNIANIETGGNQYRVMDPADDHFVVEYVSPHGLPLQKFEINRSGVSHYTPIVAIINYELTAQDPVISPLLFPYMGGSPAP